jgi:hypothetical protein
MLWMNLTIASCVMFTTGVASIHLVKVLMPTNKNLKPPGALGRMSDDVYSPYHKTLGEIDGSEWIRMLRSLLLEELALFTLGDNFHCVILS